MPNARTLAMIAALACLVAATSRAIASNHIDAITDIALATPRADCGPGSAPEPDLQGRVPLADYDSGRANDPYTCNTELVGHYGITGGFQVIRTVDEAGHECAIYDSTLVFGKDLPKGTDPGTYVLDMTDPANPVRTATLQTPAMLSPHESMRLHQGRGLLVANMGSPSTQAGFVDIYDVSEDCRAPELRSSLPLAIAGHEGGFSPDGNTYWATTTAAPGIVAIDVTDATNPSILWQSFEYASHGVSLSPDGTRAYLARVGDWVSTTTQGAGGLTILDVSDIQNRVSDPQVSVISEMDWPEVTIPQNSIETVIDGERYLIEFDEYDSNVWQANATDHVSGVRILDLDDPSSPSLVGRVRLEVHQLDARGGDLQNDPGWTRVGQGYAPHYCSIPRYEDPGIMACTMILSGLRVFDIRDPSAPKEIAYFNQPLMSGADPSERGAYAMAAPAFAPDRNEIWYSDSNTGFFVVRLTNGAWVQ